MDKSIYIKTFELEDKPDSYLLYSTKRALKMVINKKFWDAFNPQKLTNQKELEFFTFCKKNGLVVESKAKEKKEMLESIDKANNEGKFFNATVVLNLQCNLACRYCFEGTQKGEFYMQMSTSESLIEMVHNKLKAGKDNITLVFYGGEPFITYSLMKHIATRVRSLADSFKAEFAFKIVTNGTLFTGKQAAELVPLGLVGARITLDGISDNHDVFRPFKNGDPSFDVIIKNIKEVIKHVKLEIGGNYTKDNYSEFPKLIDYLYKQGITPDKLYMLKFDPVMQLKSKFALSDFTDGCVSSDEPWAHMAHSYLREEIMKRGYTTGKLVPSACVVEFKDNLIINYDGLMYKCPPMLGHKEYAVGSLDRGIENYTEKLNLNSWWQNKKCLSCEYLPICFGGCRYIKNAKDGNMKGMDCKKKTLDSTLEVLIKQEVKYNQLISKA